MRKIKQNNTIKKTVKKDDEIINFYELDEVKAFCPEYHNPCYCPESMPLKHPMFLVIVGCQGSGKTNILMNIIQKMDSTFNYIKIFTANKEEPLYLFLESKINKPYLEIFDGDNVLDNVQIDGLEKGQYLYIFDDLCLEKNQDKIEKLFIRGRKCAERQGVSCVYLSQMYFRTPSDVRKNMNALILKKINGKRDIANILRETSINAESDQLLNMFKHCVKTKDDIANFLLIDLAGPEEQRFRKNFCEILDVKNF